MDHGLPALRLSVNLASRDLSNPDLFDNIDRTLMETGIDPSLLELEITERVVLDKSGPGPGRTSSGSAGSVCGSPSTTSGPATPR